MNYRKMWLFQSNPKRYRLLDSLANPRLEEDVWEVNQHKREICSGHIALIWQCGKMVEKGIYAVVDVTSKGVSNQLFELLQPH